MQMMLLLKIPIEVVATVGPRGAGPGSAAWCNFVSCRLRARLFCGGSITRCLPSSRHEAVTYNENPSQKPRKDAGSRHPPRCRSPTIWNICLKVFFWIQYLTRFVANELLNPSFICKYKMLVMREVRICHSSGTSTFESTDLEAFPEQKYLVAKPIGVGVWTPTTLAGAVEVPGRGSWGAGEG